MTVMPQKVVVIGVGNPFRSDDAVGRVVVRQLRKGVPPGVQIVEETGDGAELLTAWEGAECVILVDAVQSGASPGTLHRLDARNETLPSWFSHVSTHAFGVGEAIELARRMGDLPANLIVYGIEGLDFSAGTRLSPEVAEEVPSAASFILQEILQLTTAQPAR
jgi:hydrogenase maturation protease